MNNFKSMKTQDINNTNDPQKKYLLGTVSKKYFPGGFKPYLVFLLDRVNELFYFLPVERIAAGQLGYAGKLSQIIQI